ncbi:hypothetical protein EVAR_20029_1 [Eumeta japonica]|uniref:Uncharacterized protein n=1 Tax=Eumeta variegata TaxID=151549 RepID=A0A4C1VA50_EUMVA|nr:hypothetical protein EVAR_20029_1 [Eumeta japonica]
MGQTLESRTSARRSRRVSRATSARRRARAAAGGNTAVNDPLKLPVTGAIAVRRSQARAFLLKRASAVVGGRPRGPRQRNDKRNSATFTVKTAPGHRTLSALCFLRARPRRGGAPRAAPGPRG